MKKTQTEFPVQHIQVTLPQSFDEVAAKLESRLGRFDPSVFPAGPVEAEAAESVRARIRAMEGPEGFMLFSVIDHGAVLALQGKPSRAKQYVLGNPLIAVEMTQQDVRAGLYAPLRLYVYAEGAGTRLEYDLPSSLFGQWGNGAVNRVAGDLDKKMEALLVFVAEN
jgi:uncharacterized protein (DUF302 family)